MSQLRPMDVICPKCGQKISATAYASINTDLAANVAETIISGERFNVKCPKCKNVIHLEYDLLYNDMKHNAMIWVIHPNQEDYEEKISQIREFSPDFWDTTRLVPDMDSLREKVACLEAGVDDRIIELCKILLEKEAADQHPEFHVESVFYTYQGEKQLVLLYDADGKSLTCNLDPRLCSMFEGLYGKALEEMEKEPYPVIDRDWAFEFMANAVSDGLPETNTEEENDTPEESVEESEDFCEPIPGQLEMEWLRDEKEEITEDVKEIPDPPTQPQPQPQPQPRAIVRPVPVTRKKQRESKPQDKPAMQEKTTPMQPAQPEFCRKCGFKLLEGSAFCSMCGTPVVKPEVICPKCGRKLPDDAVFCHYCGTAVEHT